MPVYGGIVMAEDAEYIAGKDARCDRIGVAIFLVPADDASLRNQTSEGRRLGRENFR